MFKIHQLFVSESSYKTGNVRCLLNGNLDLLGMCPCMCSMIVSVSVSCPCPVIVSLLHIDIRVHVGVIYSCYIFVLCNLCHICDCVRVCVMSVFDVCILTTYTYPCRVRVHVICTCYIFVSCPFLCSMFVSIFVFMFVSV